MNLVVEIGRLTRDPEANNGAVRLSIAVTRRFKNKEGQYDTDFINCVSFAKTGEFIQKYFHKGDKIAITGRIQTGSYTNSEGKKVYTTDVVVDNAEFVESKGGSAPDSTPSGQTKKESTSKADFMQVPSGDDDELPFN
jgi:single-strand DNA-binding protein